MPPQSSSDYDLQLQKTLHDLQQLGKHVSNDIMLIFSEHDLDASISPRTIKRDLENVGFKWLKFKFNNVLQTYCFT